MQAMTVFCYNNEFRAVNCRGYCSAPLFCYACTLHPIAFLIERYGVALFFFVIEIIFVHRHDNGLILGVFSLEWRMFMLRCVCSCAIFLMAAVYFSMRLELFAQREGSVLICDLKYTNLSTYDFCLLLCDTGWNGKLFIK